jgi:hypothetical protein
MDLYETDRDTLEDVLYRRLQMLWEPFTDVLKVFQRQTPPMTSLVFFPLSISVLCGKRTGIVFLIFFLFTFFFFVFEVCNVEG